MAAAKAEKPKAPKVVASLKPASKNGDVRKTPPKKAAVKKPAPKKTAPTKKELESWFFSLTAKEFAQYSKDWNERNFKIRLPKKSGYDQWLNYFKTLTPSQIKQLAITGVDFLPTEAYAALSRWHDIIKSPGRIDKIHQSGLTGAQNSKKSVLEMAQSNDRLGVLMAIRDSIAEKLAKPTGARDTAALARELTEIMTQIADYEKRQGPKKTTQLGKLISEFDVKAKRPNQNGGGARHTSFKSRVTIDDVEAL